MQEQDLLTYFLLCKLLLHAVHAPAIGQYDHCVD